MTEMYHEFPAFKSIAQAVLYFAHTEPDKFCIADDRMTVTYGQFAQVIFCLSRKFAALGVKCGARVLVEASQSIQFLASELAIHLLGAIFVPVERHCATPKLEDFVRRTGALLTITNDELRNSIGCQTVLFSELIGSFDCKVAEITVTPPLHSLIKYIDRTDTLSEILFSSGTTGKEKGVVLDHGADIALAQNVSQGVQIKHDNVEFILSPLNHSHGLRRYYANMYLGASVVIQDSVMNINNLFEKTDKYLVNSMDMVPSALKVVLALGGEQFAKYADRIRYLQFGGAPLPEEQRQTLRKMFPRSHLYNMYGSTESGVSCICDFSSDSDKNSIGWPSCNSELFVADEEHKRVESSAAHPGILACRSSANMRGYWNDSFCAIEHAEYTESKDAFYSDDLAYIKKSGEVILLGRRNDVINVGGFKVLPQEIEETALLAEGVKDCACAAVSDDNYGQLPVLLVVLDHNTALSRDFQIRLRKFLSERIETYKVPADIVQVHSIPRTAKGSVQRRKLADLLSGLNRSKE